MGMTPLYFIQMLRSIYPERYADHQGNCFKFYLLLKSVFPQAKGWYNHNHTLAEIDGKFCDIDGEVESIEGYLPIEEFGEDWMFEQYKEFGMEAFR